MTPAQSRALKKYAEKQEAKGIKIVAVRLSRNARYRLDQLAKAYGSKQKALEALLNGD